MCLQNFINIVLQMKKMTFSRGWLGEGGERDLLSNISYMMRGQLMNMLCLKFLKYSTPYD